MLRNMIFEPQKSMTCSCYTIRERNLVYRDSIPLTKLVLFIVPILFFLLGRIYMYNIVPVLKVISMALQSLQKKKKKKNG